MSKYVESTHQKTLFAFLKKHSNITLQATDQKLNNSELFTKLITTVDSDSYRQLTLYTAQFYKLSITEAKWFSQHQFQSPFWLNWRKRNHAQPLWQDDKFIYIGLHSPTQQVDSNSIMFKFQRKCVYVLLQGLQDARGFITQQSRAKSGVNSIIDNVERLINDAISRNASDIHLEPYEKKARIRFRCDGVLAEHSLIDTNTLSSMLSRLKVMSNLDIAEKRLPQDGRMLFKSNRLGNKDLRISTMPTIFGEKMVIRILNQSQSQLPLTHLGLSPRQLTLLNTALQNPHGMILTTGPTGSGKTNTLYALIDRLNNADVNILSVEDPVEIYLDGINQINTNNKAGLDFAKVLRGLLRQDPDIIMVGEIRDIETADIALKAAQTGHLLLSSLHTNNALASIQRLIDMGIPNYRLGAAINVLIAQRLIRRLCQSCKEPAIYEQTIWQKFGLTKEDKIFTANGCAACHQGYAGRIGIFEIIKLEPELFSAIINNDRASITDALDKQQFHDLRHSAVQQVKRGISSLEEINRVL